MAQDKKKKKLSKLQVRRNTIVKAFVKQGQLNISAEHKAKKAGATPAQMKKLKKKNSEARHKARSIAIEKSVKLDIKERAAKKKKAK